MSKVAEGSATDADIPILPWEAKEESENSVEENLFDILGSDPDFQEEEDLEDENELESDEDPDDEDTDETEDEDSDDGEEDGEDELEEDDDDEDGEDEEEDSSDEPERRPVKVDGEVIAEVTFDEAIAGYSLQSDYTRKRQAAVKEQSSAMEEIRVVRQTYDGHLEQLQAVMKQMTPAGEPDEELRKSDPGEYAAQKQDHADRIIALQKVADERARVQAEKDKEDTAAQAVYLKGEMDKLIIAIPGWDNDATRETEVAKLRDFAIETYGFTGEELDNVVDHRLLLLLNENLQSRAKVTKGKKEIKKKKKGVRKMKPGTSRSSRQSGRGKARKAQQRARNELAQTGSVHDAAAAIEGLLGDDD